MGEKYSTHGRDEKSTNKIIDENPKGKKPVGRPTHRWDDNI
jgi:hypothetical protein